MNKKVLLLVLIMVAAVPSLFAADNTVLVAGSPYAKQFVSTNVNTEYQSEYGFGAKLGYRYIDNGVFLGTDVGYQNFKYYNKGSETVAYLQNLQFLVKMGGKVRVAERISFNLDIGGGLNVGISRGANNYYNPMVAAGGTISFRLGNNLAAVAGLDASLEWAKSKDSVYKSTQVNLVPHLGAEINF